MRSGNRERAGEHPHRRTCYHVLPVRAHTVSAVRNHHLRGHNARNCRDADELMAQRYRETISSGGSPQRDGHVERGEEDREFSFFQGETNTWSNRPLPLFWKGHNALLFARCTRDASANSTSFLIIVPLINYSYSLLWIWKRYILSLF